MFMRMNFSNKMWNDILIQNFTEKLSWLLRDLKIPYHEKITERDMSW